MKLKNGMLHQKGSKLKLENYSNEHIDAKADIHVNGHNKNTSD